VAGGRVVGGAAVLAAASQASLPCGPVPLTLQTLGLFVVAGLAGARLASAAWCCG
jgi:biotin transporter BioY